jgi:hypothetical protein
MGLIHIDLFTTPDGVAQAPGGPDEDADDGFAFGGWQAPLFDGGKKVFADGVVPTSLRLIGPVVASPKGAVMQRYALAEGTPGVGDMSAVVQEG